MSRSTAPGDGGARGMVPFEGVRRLACVVVAVLVTTMPAAPGRASVADAPSVTGITWLPRGGTTSAPVLNVRLTIDAPAGLASGEVRLGSVFHEVLATVALEARPPGSHGVDVALEAPGDKLRPWEVIGLTLTGGDGETTTYGFCELASVVETREKATTPRLGLACLDGPGWVVYTVRAEAAPSATIWMRGVATRDNTYAGVGHVLQDASGAVVTWGTGLAVAYPQRRDGTYVSAGGNTLVDDPSPDPAAQPGTRRVVIGVGGSAPGDLVPGGVYRWAAYYAVRPGHFDLPFISLEGTGLTVLSVETGSTAGIAWGSDFGHSVVVQRSATDTAVAAHGSLSRSFERSTTCMFGFLGGRIAGALAANVGRIDGPSAPPVGGVVVAGQPGAYRFDAIAGAADSSGQHVVAYADMPIAPQ